MSADDVNKPATMLTDAKPRPYSPTGEAEEKEFGGTLAGMPMPREPFYPLRVDQFFTLRDGELSEARAVRDACLSAFVAAAVGIAGLVALIKWDAPITQQKVAIGATAILCVGAAATVVVAWVQQRHIKRTQNESSYSRLVGTIEGHFQIAPEHPQSKSIWNRWLGRKTK